DRASEHIKAVELSREHLGKSILHQLNVSSRQIRLTLGHRLTLHKTEDAKTAAICIEIIEARLVRAINCALGNPCIDGTPVPVDRRKTLIYFAGTDIVICDAPLAFRLGYICNSWSICAGEHNLRACIKQGSGAILLSHRIVPGIDPAHIHCAL